MAYFTLIGDSILNELRLFFSYALRHKYSYLLGVFFLFCTNWIAVNIPFYIGQSIDLLGASADDDYQRLINNIYLVVVLSVCLMLTRTVSRMLFFNPGRSVELDIKNDAFKKLTQLQQGFYRTNPVGGLISIVNNDINGIRAMAGVGMMTVFNIAFTLSMAPMKMWQISPSLMLYCLVPVVISFILVNYAITRMRELMRERMRYLQTLSTKTVNFLNGVEVIKSHQIQDWAVNEFEHSNQAILDISLQQLRIRSFFMPLLEYTDTLLKILVLGVGGWYLLQSTMSLGQLTAFLAYVSLLALPFMASGRLISTIQMGLVSLKSMGRILNQEVGDKDTLDKSEKEALFSQGLVVKNLSYRYPDATDDASNWVLKNISFDIKPGEKVAILGRVGSGKTTLVNCLNRFQDIPTGSVFIDGKDISELSRAELRSVVRTITQEPFLFSDSVVNNIQFGATERTDQMNLDEVLYQSAMQKEVANFPDGVQTLVGEKGILLSGGQKQRISLARGMFTPAKLMVLDNVLSAVDNETERFLLEQILHQGHTSSSLIVSHRQAVLERVDRILLLDKGEIVARGSHAELLASSELYRDTWQFLQTGVEGDN